MSIFTSLVTKTLEVPADPGQTITIRRLPPKHLDAASRSSQRASIDMVREIGPSFLKELQSLTDEAVKTATVRDPLLTYDKQVLIAKGVVSWSYDVPREAEYFEDLDVDTQDWLAREILRLARPSLFQTADESEATRKNA